MSTRRVTSTDPERPVVRAVSLLLLLLLAHPLSGAAQGSAGSPDDPYPASPSAAAATEGALFLLLPVGAQAVGIGRAMTSVASQEAAFWNPAGLAGLQGSRVLAYRGNHLVGDVTAVSGLMGREGLGTLGLSYQLLDVGSQDLTDDQGNVMGSISVRSHQAILSMGTRLSASLDLGTNLKFVRFGLSCRGQCPEASVSASSYAFDIGLQSEPFPSLPFRVGAMVAHLGPRLKVVNVEKADPLPTRMRLSLGYELLDHLLPEEELDFRVLVEVEDRWNGERGDPSLYVGSEFTVGGEDIVFLRGGYILGGGTQTDAAAVGFGLRYERIELGIARSLARANLGSASEPVHVTLGFRF